jgi:hypothetical protein
MGERGEGEIFVYEVKNANKMEYHQNAAMSLKVMASYLLIYLHSA